MKRVIVLFMVLVTCILGFTGCNTNANKYKPEDLGVFDTESQKSFKLGDSRETIEKYIGKARKDEPSDVTGSDVKYCHYGDRYLSTGNDGELIIEYNENDIAIGFWLRPCWDEEDNRFQLPSGVSVLSTVDQFQNSYPGFTESKDINYISVVQLRLRGSNYVTGYDKDDYAKYFDKYDNDEEYHPLSDKNWAYIYAAYDDYTEIDWIFIGYGWYNYIDFDE